MWVRQRASGRNIDVLTATRDQVIDDVVSALSRVKGVRAVALGGSRSIGTANPASDYDMAVFQDKIDDIDVPALEAALEQLAGSKPKMTDKLALAEFQLGGHKVELFFRRFDVIASEIEAARKGHFRRWPHALHAAGYLSTVLISYIAYARPVWDPQGQLARLVAATDPYPETLRNQMLSTFKVEAALSLMHAAKVRLADETPYIAGLYSRAVATWTLILFALNRRYPIIDKGATKIIMTLPQHPENYAARTIKLFRDLGAGNLQQVRDDAAQLHREITGDTLQL